MSKRIVKTALRAVLLLAVVLCAVLTWNTLRLSRQAVLASAPALPALDANAAAARLGGALKFRTLAASDEVTSDPASFAQLQAYLAQAFPRLHARLKREVVGQSLLYTWTGRDASAAPVLWLAHQDVVPVAPGTESSWQEAPFDGTVKAGYIWGRGAWDDKGNLLAQMEAIELLLGAGYQPRQTIYLAYGADEEVGGKGARAIAALLAARHLRFDYVLDEGMLVTQAILTGLAPPAALIGVAEKGYATIKLEVTAAPGHSSMPPRHTAIGTLSAALARLERAQLPATLQGVTRDMFDAIAPEMGGVNRVVLSNLWLFAPLLERQLAQTPSTNALLRTTTALTVVHAGNKENVLPGNAKALVNFRLRPGDSVAGVLAHARNVVADDAISLSVEPGASEPSPVSPSAAPQFALLARTAREVFPGAIVAPALVLGATDARHYAALSENVYRFSPVRAGPSDLARFHGTNERISVSNYAEMIRFYHQLLKNGDHT
jgi:carboxypeptidase PM20D1